MLTFHFIFFLLHYDISSFSCTSTVVKKRTPFDDNAESIQHLTVLVKEELHANSVILKELKQILAEQQEEQQASKHASTIVNALDSRLSYVAGRFQSVLKTRTQQIKQQRQRKREFSYESPNNLYSNRGLLCLSIANTEYGGFFILFHCICREYM